MSYLNQTLKRYLDDLSAKKPTPGGGSVSALASSLGTALISMVCNFTIGKPRYKDVEEEIRKFLEENETLRLRLAELIDLDISAYEKVSQIRKFSQEKREENAEKLQGAIRGAVLVPLEVCQLSIKALKICKDLIDKANVHLISDLSIAANLLKAGFLSALANIEINLFSLKDKEFIVKIRQILEPLMKENETLPYLIQESVKEKMNKTKIEE
ncbi:MAG: cyclodeaminase/cyclohydrolase family protein [Candidatus Omnitrophica bacterium]|nr:cyclodeaminase/cyclohydrolase family protein [Candidatus Omnitrophota bacterium]MCM8798096.1 cyclodeaminase/cyclohydrolase family protein [Candidatus Omnitrophota bacterium]